MIVRVVACGGCAFAPKQGLWVCTSTPLLRSRPPARPQRFCLLRSAACASSAACGWCVTTASCMSSSALSSACPSGDVLRYLQADASYPTLSASVGKCPGLCASLTSDPLKWCVTTCCAHAQALLEAALRCRMREFCLSPVVPSMLPCLHPTLRHLQRERAKLPLVQRARHAAVHPWECHRASRPRCVPFWVCSSSQPFLGPCAQHNIWLRIARRRSGWVPAQRMQPAAQLQHLRQLPPAGQLRVEARRLRVVPQRAQRRWALRPR
jgi:hypothetical protein